MKYTIIFLLLFTFQISYSQEKTKLDYLDVFDLQYVSSPSISEDGGKIAYLRNQFDIMTDRKFSTIWVINSDGSGHYPITSGKNNHFSPIWSPDGKKLAYLSGDEGATQIFIYYTDIGKSSSITNLNKSPGEISWSPDGKWLAFAMAVPVQLPTIGKIPSPPKGATWVKPPSIIKDFAYKSDGNPNLLETSYRHLFIISSEGGGVKQLTSGDFNHGNYSWSPDSKSLIFTADRETGSLPLATNNHIYEVSIGDQKLTKITKGEGPYTKPTISPDGKSIAYGHTEDKKLGYQQESLYIMDRSGANSKKINHNLDRDIQTLDWDQTGKGLFISYDSEGIGRISHVSLDGKVTNLVKDLGGTSWGRPYSGGDFSITPSGKFAYTRTSTDQPSTLAFGTQQNPTESKELVNLNVNYLSSKKIGKVEEIWYESTFDKQKVQGWVVYPPDFDPLKKYPLILEIHGGPHTAYGPHFSAEIQLMASQGYVVLYTNPRGSTSYGSKFASYINHNYPSQDYDDLISGVDALINKGFIDTKRLYVTGGSGGGVLTAWIISKTDRFAAAVVSKPVINWASFALYADGYPFFTNYWFTKYPWEDPMQYFNRSPISRVGFVNTPTMLVTGENDYRTPMGETEQYYGALKLRGIETMMVRMSDAGHNITARPSNLIRHVGYIVGWFDKHVENKIVRP
jgi:dipeptidyl aminopeptidase/acylaminoacyl peptidase